MSAARESQHWPPPPRVRIVSGQHAGRAGALVRRERDVVTVDLGGPVDGGSGIVRVPASYVRDDDTPIASPEPSPRVWKVGDRVRIVGGSPQLLGAVGAVVEVDLPGPWPIRVEVEGRRGFGQVQRAADELEAEGGPAAG